MIVVDDALLLLVLAEAAPGGIQADAITGEVFTTGSWYWRLSRAVLDRASAGALSRAFAELTADEQGRVLVALHSLPGEIGLLNLRQLVPTMTALDARRRLNLLTAEVVATALVLDATVAVTTRSALLNDSCATFGVDLRHIDL